MSRAELSASAGVAANIHYGDVLIKFGEYLDMRKETFPWIEKQTDADKFRTSFLQDGDVVFADTAEDETVGKCCEIRNCGSMVIISGLHTMPCRPESKFASGYLGYYLNSTAFHEQLVLKESERPSSLVAQAVSYALNIEEELKKFLKDSRLNIDNNPAERLNRGIAIIRKNCLFAGSEAGGQRLAILLCKSQGAEPSILRFLFIFFVRPSFLPYETKKLHLQFLAVLFQNL